jgi:hypothetical protein
VVVVCGSNVSCISDIHNKQPPIFLRLLRTVTIETLDGPEHIRALFDRGANVFILNQERAQINNLFVMEQEKPILLLGFSGQEDTSFGKYFAPLINLKIKDHISKISCQIGPLETGIDFIIPG